MEKEGRVFMRFGVWGYRHPHIGDFIREMLKLGHEFVGVCEKEPDLAKPLAEVFKVPLFTDEEWLFSLKPDIIGTSAVNSSKISIIESCAAHGIHVMADKPAVTNVEDYERLARTVNEGSVQIGLMLTERFNAPIYALHKLITEGRLGRLVNISIMKPHKLNALSRSKWHFSKHDNGGLIVDLLVHDFDLLRWLTGSEIAECKGYIKKGGNKRHPDFFDSTQLAVRMDNDVTATLEADWWIPDKYRNYGDGRIFCVGTEGRVEVRTVEDLTDPERRPLTIFMDSDGGCTICPLAEPALTLTEDYINRIHGMKDCIITHSDILKCTYAALRADREAKKIVVTD